MRPLRVGGDLETRAYSPGGATVKGRSVPISGDLGDGFERGRLLAKLRPVERGIAAALAQELVVAAAFVDEAAIDDENGVGMHDRRQPVGDDDRGAPLAELRHRLLYVALGFGIERRSGLVEQDDRCVLDQRARDGDALALAAGKLQAVLADRGVVAGREARDEN